MIAKLIRWSIVNRFLVLLATLIVSAWGIYSVMRTPLDALPDLSDVQVIIRTSYPGQAPRLVDYLPHDHHHAVCARSQDGAWLFFFW
jgi:copper/silver efflux system protein